MENHNFSWENPLFLWCNGPFSIAINGMFTRPGTTKFRHGIHGIHRHYFLFLKSYYFVLMSILSIPRYLYLYLSLYQSVFGSFFAISILRIRGVFFLRKVAFLDDWIEDPEEPTKASRRRWRTDGWFHHLTNTWWFKQQKPWKTMEKPGKTMNFLAS